MANRKIHFYSWVPNYHETHGPWILMKHWDLSDLPTCKNLNNATKKLLKLLLNNQTWFNNKMWYFSLCQESFFLIDDIRFRWWLTVLTHAVWAEFTWCPFSFLQLAGCPKVCKAILRAWTLQNLSSFGH